LRGKIYVCVLNYDEMIHQQISNTRLSKDEIVQLLHTALAGDFLNQRVLVLIPDHTRSLPLPLFFRSLVEVLHDVKQLDFMIALGTHPPLDETSLLRLVDITAEAHNTKYANIRLLNHAWDDPEVLEIIGTITQDEVKEIAGERWHPSLGGDLPVRINKAVFDYDHILILGPTFPHEVVGFSGGAKYFFPGISGPEMINKTHWLGALAGVRNTIGIIETPVRAMIHAAAENLTTPVTLISLVVEGEAVAGMFIGDPVSAWQASAKLSSERHILWFDKPFQRVLSSAPPMYDELWTAAKAMYKLDPVIANGGEVIIYAPHLQEVSYTHGKYIYEVGYHVLEYFLKQWDKYKHIPLGVLAHSTHVRGDGRYEKGQEHARVKVTLSSQISEGDCARLSLGYLNPSVVRIHEWENREGEGVLFAPKAGEMLYRVRKE
jgi:nickel-dependent lactate racemase